MKDKLDKWLSETVEFVGLDKKIQVHILGNIKKGLLEREEKSNGKTRDRTKTK